MWWLLGFIFIGFILFYVVVVIDIITEALQKDYKKEYEINKIYNKQCKMKRDNNRKIAEDAWDKECKKGTNFMI